jgi:hypothetical protein
MEQILREHRIERLGRGRWTRDARVEQRNSIVNTCGTRSGPSQRDHRSRPVERSDACVRRGFGQPDDDVSRAAADVDDSV